MAKHCGFCGKKLYWFRKHVCKPADRGQATSARNPVSAAARPISSPAHTLTPSQSSDDGNFTLSLAAGYATNNGIIGGLVGGNLTGGIIGDALNDSDRSSPSGSDDSYDAD